MDLKEAKIIITGATSGIGYEIARVAKEKGAQVLISGRNSDRVKQASEKLGVHGFKADVTNEDEVIALINYAKTTFGNFNVVINNAGFGGFSSLVDTSLSNFEEQWSVNTKGLFLTGREAAKHFIEQQYGNIINIGSTAATKGFANGSAYVASKFAVTGLTECWRAELRKHNIRVMQVNPSEVETPFFEKAGLTQESSSKKLKPSEIAHVIMAMLSLNDVGFIPDAAVWATNPW